GENGSFAENDGPGRSGRVGVHRGRRGARPERAYSAGSDRRDGPYAAAEQDRRPRPLGQPDDADVDRRRAEDGAGDRPVGQDRRDAGDDEVRPGEPDGDGFADAVRRGRAARHERRTEERGGASDRRQADSGAAVNPPSPPAPSPTKGRGGAKT